MNDLYIFSENGDFVYKKALNYLPQFLKMTAGTLLMGIALNVFMVPFKIAPGGVSGLATVVHYLSGLKMSVLIFLINIPIFIAGLICFDFRFLVRSLYGIISLSFFVEVMNFISLSTDDALLACCFGGAILGTGIAFVIDAGGTSGGTDIIVLIIRKRFPNISVGRLFLAIDGVIILIAGLVFKSSDSILYSAAALLISSYVTDAVLNGVKFARVVYIISDKYEEITSYIYRELERGVTGIKSVSMYTKKDSNILMCVVRPHELFKLKKIIKAVDADAFVIVSEAKEVVGNGFEINIS